MSRRCFLLRFLAQTIVGGRIVLLGAYREAEQRVHELVELFAELARVGHRIPLRGLSRAEVGIYVSRVAARPARKQWSPRCMTYRRQPLLRR